MKLFILRLSLSVSMCCAFTLAHAGPYKLEEGFYMMSASALYSTLSDEISTWQTKLVRKEHLYSLSFIGGKNGHIAFTVDEKGRLDIIQGIVRHGERGEKVDGKGRLVGDNLIKGTIKRYEYFLEMPLVYTTEKSEWYLRPATVTERKQLILNALELEIDLLFQDGKITLEELKTINDRDTNNKIEFFKQMSRYSSVDQALFLQMITNGEIQFIYGKGIVLDDSVAKDVNAQQTPPPISNKTKKKEHPLSEEDLAKLKKRIEDNTPPASTKVKPDKPNSAGSPKP